MNTKEGNMLKKIRRLALGMTMPIFLLSLIQVGMASISKGTLPTSINQQTDELQDRVRHSLLMLPYYGVFDALSYSVQGDTATLTGEVRRPLLKSEAEAAVRKIAGVANVVNNIEILPLSPMDDSLRLRIYRAIYSQPGFEKYGIQAVKPIRIIVKNGNTTLYGVVATQLDKKLAEMAARNVPFAFSVTDKLTTD
jgi:hyperosmotically inducible periplasmic protein